MIHKYNSVKTEFVWMQNDLSACVGRILFVDCFAFVFRILTLTVLLFFGVTNLQMHSSQQTVWLSIFKPLFQDTRTNYVQCSAFECQICVCVFTAYLWIALLCLQIILTLFYRRRVWKRATNVVSQSGVLLAIQNKSMSWNVSAPCKTVCLWSERVPSRSRSRQQCQRTYCSLGRS